MMYAAATPSINNNTSNFNNTNNNNNALDKSTSSSNSSSSNNNNNNNNKSTTNTSTIINNNAWRRRGQKLRTAMVEHDEKSGGQSFVLSDECPISRYYQVADRVLDQFLHHPIDSREELLEAYMVGHRLVKFLSNILPTHVQYFNNGIIEAQARDNSQEQLVSVLKYLEQIAILIDKNEHEDYINNILRTSNNNNNNTDYYNDIGTSDSDATEPLNNTTNNSNNTTNSNNNSFNHHHQQQEQRNKYNQYSNNNNNNNASNNSNYNKKKSKSSSSAAAAARDLSTSTGGGSSSVDVVVETGNSPSRTRISLSPEKKYTHNNNNNKHTGNDKSPGNRLSSNNGLWINTTLNDTTTKQEHTTVLTERSQNKNGDCIANTITPKAANLSSPETSFSSGSRSSVKVRARAWPPKPDPKGTISPDTSPERNDTSRSLSKIDISMEDKPQLLGGPETIRLQYKPQTPLQRRSADMDNESTSSKTNNNNRRQFVSYNNNMNNNNRQENSSSDESNDIHNKYSHQGNNNNRSIMHGKFGSPPSTSQNQALDRNWQESYSRNSPDPDTKRKMMMTMKANTNEIVSGGESWMIRGNNNGRNNETWTTGVEELSLGSSQFGSRGANSSDQGNSTTSSRENIKPINNRIRREDEGNRPLAYISDDDDDDDEEEDEFATTTTTNNALGYAVTKSRQNLLATRDNHTSIRSTDQRLFEDPSFREAESIDTNSPPGQQHTSTSSTTSPKEEEDDDDYSHPTVEQDFSVNVSFASVDFDRDEQGRTNRRNNISQHTSNTREDSRRVNTSKARMFSINDDPDFSVDSNGFPKESSNSVPLPTTTTTTTDTSTRLEKKLSSGRSTSLSYSHSGRSTGLNSHKSNEKKLSVDNDGFPIDYSIEEKRNVSSSKSHHSIIREGFGSETSSAISITGQKRDADVDEDFSIDSNGFPKDSSLTKLAKSDTLKTATTSSSYAPSAVDWSIDEERERSMKMDAHGFPIPSEEVKPTRNDSADIPVPYKNDKLTLAPTTAKYVSSSSLVVQNNIYDGLQSSKSTGSVENNRPVESGWMKAWKHGAVEGTNLQSKQDELDRRDAAHTKRGTDSSSTSVASSSNSNDVMLHEDRLLYSLSNVHFDGMSNDNLILRQEKSPYLIESKFEQSLKNPIRTDSTADSTMHEKTESSESYNSISPPSLTSISPPSLNLLPSISGGDLPADSGSIINSLESPNRQQSRRGGGGSNNSSSYSSRMRCGKKEKKHQDFLVRRLVDDDDDDVTAKELSRGGRSNLRNCVRCLLPS